MTNELMKSVEYSYRIIDVGSDLLELLKNRLNRYDLEINKYYKNKSNFVISLQLDESLDYGQFADVLNSVCNLKKGLYVSLVTESDSDGLSIPIFVIDLFRRIGGTIDFSFTSV